MSRMLTEPLNATQQATLTSGRDMWSTAEIPEHGIVSRKLADGPIGIASGRVDERDISLLSPCGICLAATWDRALLSRIGSLIGLEAAKRAISFVMAPNLNLLRSPLSGRAFEMYSEDPLLSGEMGAAWIEGLQSQGVGSVAKHLVCNDSETERQTMNSVVDERALREVYLLPFEMAVRSGCAGVMAAYNKINGVHCVENHWLLTKVVKQDWQFEGFTVSDWFGVLDTVASANAGLDLEMPGPSRFLGSHLLSAVEQGSVAPERLADAAKRVADTVRRFSDDRAKALSSVATIEVLTEAAAAGFCLLKNANSILPLQARRGQRIAVIGPNATAPCYQGGTFAKVSVDPTALTPLQAIEARLGGECAIHYRLGTVAEPRLPSLPARPAASNDTSSSKGLLVEYFESHDLGKPPVASEVRDTNSLTWFHGMPGNLIVTDRPAAIRVRGFMTPDLSGEHEFFAGATGSVRLSVNGTLLIDEIVKIDPRDVMGRLKAGDAAKAPYLLTKDKEVSVSIEFFYEPARAQGVWFGVRKPDQSAALLSAAIDEAASADIAILIVGETADASVESKDRSTSALPNSQVNLIERVCAANPNTIVVVNSAHATDLSWRHSAAAVLMVWYPGEQFGRALAEVLAGDREPGGRLPLTIAEREQDYPAFDLTPDKSLSLPYEESWRIGYRSFSAREIEPAFALGSGFGYATFEYSDASFDSTMHQVTVTVTNTSKRAGKEVVQVFTTHDEDGMSTSILVGFDSVWVDAGASIKVAVPLDPRAFQNWDLGTSQWMQSGRRRGLQIGSSLSRIRLRMETPNVQAELLPPPDNCHVLRS